VLAKFEQCVRGVRLPRDAAQGVLGLPKPNLGIGERPRLAPNDRQDEVRVIVAVSNERRLPRFEGLGPRRVLVSRAPRAVALFFEPPTLAALALGGLLEAGGVAARLERAVRGLAHTRCSRRGLWRQRPYARFSRSRFFTSRLS
jgi:hypothetical protein